MNGKKDEAIQRSPESEAFNLAQREAAAWAASSLIPKAYQGNVPNVLIAMEMAKRIGASVMAVMQNLYIVHGNPAFGASFLIATVNGSGRFTPIRYRMEGEVGKDSWGCRAYAEDKETGEECLGPLVSVKMAKAEGWWSKKDRQGNECSKWQTMPELMLHYRAAAFWTRVYCPELSMGIHTTEEMEDIAPIQASPAEVVSPIEALTDKLEKEAESKEPEPTPEPDKPNPRESERGLQDEIQRLAKVVYGEDWLDGLQACCDANSVNMEKMGEEGEIKIVGILSGQLEGVK